MIGLRAGERMTRAQLVNRAMHALGTSDREGIEAQIDAAVARARSRQTGC